MFGAPLWLSGLLALAIPLALHLWSRRPRDVIRVGSLRHLGDVTAARTWSTRLTEPLLLALRLALLTTIVLALAGPRLEAPRLGSAPDRLVLIDPALLADSLALTEPLLDSLVRHQAKVRLLARGLPRRRLWDPRTSSYGATPLADPGPSSALWDALVEADRMVGPGGTLVVIARPLVTRLGGRRPRLTANVEWHVPPGPERREWTAARWVTPADSVYTIRGSGDAGTVQYVVRIEAGECAGCKSVPLRRVALQTRDVSMRRRLSLALWAVAEELGQPVDTVTDPGEADLLLASADSGEAPLRAGAVVLRLTEATILGPLLADTLLNRWPWPALARDRQDTREATVRQAAPDTGRREPEPADSRRGRQFLLVFAAGLLVLERWFATRPQDRTA